MKALTVVTTVFSKKRQIYRYTFKSILMKLLRYSIRDQGKRHKYKTQQELFDKEIDAKIKLDY